MKLRRLLIVLCLALTVSIGAAALSACNPENNDDTILTGDILVIEGTVETSGTQTVNVTIADSVSNVTFASDISVGDVQPADALVLKTVSAVEYVSSTELNITFSGDISISGESATGRIVISKDVMSSGVEARGSVTIVRSTVTYTKYTLEQLYTARVNDTTSEVLGKTIEVGGKVSFVNPTDSNAICIQDGDYALYISLIGSPAGADLVKDGADLIVRGTLDMVQNVNFMRLSVSENDSDGFEQAARSYTVNVLNNDKITGAAAVYEYSSSMASLTGLEVTSVDTSTANRPKIKVKMTDGTEVEFRFNVDVDITAAVGDTLSFNGPLIMRVTSGGTVIFARSADEVKIS